MDRSRTGADPVTWIDKAAAAERIGVSYASVDLWTRTGVLSSRFEGREAVVRLDEVEAIAAERRRWVSIAEAAEIASTSRHLIKKAVQEGQIEKRPDAHRRLPGLSRESVERFAVNHAKALEREERAAKAAEAQAAREKARRDGPPTDTGPVAGPPRQRFAPVTSAAQTRLPTIVRDRLRARPTPTTPATPTTPTTPTTPPSQPTPTPEAVRSRSALHLALLHRPDGPGQAIGL